MKKIFIVTEGPSEEHFAKAILAPHFLDYDKKGGIFHQEGDNYE